MSSVPTCFQIFRSPQRWNRKKASRVLKSLAFDKRILESLSASLLHPPLLNPTWENQTFSKRLLYTRTQPLRVVNNGTGTHNHSLFEEQIKELETERNTNSDPITTTTVEADFQDSLHEMNEERELLYGFTDEEKDAWTDASNNKVDGKAFMKELGRLHELQDQKDQMGKNEIYQENQSLHHEENNRFTHLTNEQKDIHMVDVGNKKVTRRIAHAQCKVIFPPSVMKAFEFHHTNHDSHELKDEIIGPKGPIFATAKIAGIMGAKKTSELIPLCHPLPLDKVSVDIQLNTLTNTATIDCHCVVTHKTGVEMEAMTGASIAALTIYDMVKAVSHEVRVTDVVLVEKQGGKRLVKDGVLMEE